MGILVVTMGILVVTMGIFLPVFVLSYPQVIHIRNTNT